MTEAKPTRINKVLSEFNISLERVVEFLNSKGVEIEARPTTKISGEVYQMLAEEFQTDKSKKVASIEVSEEKRKEQEALKSELEKTKPAEVIKAKATVEKPKAVGKIDLDPKSKAAPEKEDTPVKEETSAKEETPVKEEAPKEVEKPKKQPKVLGKIELQDPKKKTSKKSAEQPSAKTSEKPKDEKPESKPEQIIESEKAPEAHKTEYQKLHGPSFTGEKVDLTKFQTKPKKEEKKSTDSDNSADSRRRKRRRIVKDTGQQSRQDKSRNKKGAKPIAKEEPSEEDVQKQIKETLEKLQGKSGKSKAAKYRREKRDAHREQIEQEERAQEENKVLEVSEFVSVNDLSSLMDVPVTKIISACMSLGMMVTMNQRLDAETMSIIAEEFGYEVKFVNAEIEENIEIEEDKPEDLEPRAPIVTVMGHVDHGKTSLLDYIREENVIAGESGGITQHIGAYSVTLKDKQRITFLDTPGHEAFTAMRARGAQVTDIAIIVVAADDDVMPQTKEAISHAQAAGVPIVFAINKIDKPTANPEKVKESLANMNLLVEDWGGKIQSQEISALKGTGVSELLDKVLLEAELLELKANPKRRANGTVVEAFLDKGRGYISTILVQNGTLKVGDYVLAGKNHGKVKAIQDERGNRLKSAGPATPVSILGLDGAPQAGDKFNVFSDEKEAKDIASRRAQLQREQALRTQKHITLDEIGRRIALGTFKELNIILKADVDGSVEALTDSFQKLSTEEIQINIIHRAVGAITESDVLLASASDAIIIGFNVRPTGNSRQLAEKEEIDIRTYSIIYDAINDLKDAMEGMLSPVLKEEVTGTVEIRETFKISKVGTIAGCMVTSGKIFRNSSVRIIRDGVVVYTGEIAALKRFKDDVKEVAKGYECGIQIKNFNNIEIGDIIEAYTQVEVKKKL